MTWSTTLAGDVGERDTVLTLTKAPVAPGGSSMYLTVGSEIVRVSGLGDRAVNVERGALGTDATTHPAGTTVERYKSPVTLTAEAGPHTHDYAATGHAHQGGDHPDLAAHMALGLAEPHEHDFAATGHSHGTAAHLHDYSASGHAHAAYSGTAHAHDYSATFSGTGHSHGAYSGTAHTHDLYSGTAHSHGTAAHTHDYAATGHSHAGGGANVKSGAVNVGAGGSAVVTFTTPFQATPHVVVTSQFASADTSTTLSVFPVATTGFTIRGAGNAAGTVAWIATDAGNP